MTAPDREPMAACSACGAEMEGDVTSCFMCGHTRRSPPLKKGQVIAGRYELLGVLGRGGMGTVYQAHDRSLDEQVALKVLSESAQGSAEANRRFRAEIKLARKIRHPNVCAIHEYGELEDMQYIVMELVDGQDLKKHIRSRGTLPAMEAIDLAKQIGEGLQAIHDAGVIHRDLKLANVMRDSGGRLRLMDFGIAKGMSDGAATSSGHILGTPECMSPEQVRGERVDARADIYSLGVMTFELLTGRPPFKADTMQAVLYMQVHEPPRLDDPAIPPAIIPVLRKALAKMPAERHASARAFVADLAAALHPSGAPEGGSAPLPLVPSAAITPSATPPAAPPKPDADLPNPTTTSRVAPALPPPNGAAPHRPSRTLPLESPPASAAAVTGRSWASLRIPPQQRLTKLTRVGGVLGAVVLAALFTYRLSDREGRDKVAPPGAQPTVPSLVEPQLDLARHSLADKDYRSALDLSARVLAIDSSNPEALGIREQAQSALREVDAAVKAARDAVARGDSAEAAAALGRVMARDPRNPVVAELSGSLNVNFSARAVAAKLEMENSRTRAEVGLGSVRSPEFAEGERLVVAAESSLDRREFSTATQAFIQARDSFDRARRAIEQKERERERASRLRPPPSGSTPLTRISTPSEAVAAGRPMPTPASSVLAAAPEPARTIEKAIDPNPKMTPTPSMAIAQPPLAAGSPGTPSPRPAPEKSATPDLATTATPARPAAPGLLIITVRPAAEIAIDGRIVATASAYSATVAPGEHVIRFTHKNWQPLFRTVAIGGGDRVRIGVDLKDEGVPAKK